MIRVTQRRNNGKECTPIVDERSVLDSTNLLVRYELGFGGQVIEFSETRIVTRTTVLNCIDTTIFEGTREEMRPLCEAAYYFSLADQHRSAIVEGMVQAAERMLGEKSGVPLYLSLATPILTGNARINVMMMLSLGITDEEDLKLGAGINSRDLVAVLDLRKENPTLPFREILQMAS